jgi:hypothetical protein
MIYLLCSGKMRRQSYYNEGYAKEKRENENIE